MPANTPRYGFQYPQPTDLTDIPDAIAIPLDTIDANVVMEYQGTLAMRPAVGVFGRRYYVVGDPVATNNGIEWFDTGSSWINIGPINTAAGNIATALPGAGQAAGSVGFAADAGHSHQREPVSTSSDIKPIGDTAQAGSTGKWVDAGHVHAGGFSLGDFKQTTNISTNYSSGPVNGFLPADGRGPYSTTGTYAAFYNACGGDANYPWTKNIVAGTFYLPDVRDRVLVAAGTTYTVGQKAGAATTQLTVNNLPSHEHPIADQQHSHGITDPQHKHSSDEKGNGAFPTLYFTASVSPQIIPGGTGYASVGTAPIYVTYNPVNQTGGASTGISVNLSYTGINGTSGTTFSNAAVSIVQPVAGVLTLVKVI